MSFAIHVAAGAARSLAIALAAIALGLPLARLLSREPRRSLAWAGVLAPFLTPALLVSYAYSGVALRLLAVPGGPAALYAAALWLRLVPVAATVLHFLPPAMSAEARWCHAQLGRSRWQRCVFLLRGAGRGPLTACALVFLLAFSDFELASLWNVKTWTTALFDAHTGGLAIGESLRLAALPLAIELAVLATLCGRATFGTCETPEPACRRALSAYLLAALAAGSLVPLAMVAVPALAGLRALAQHAALGGHVLASLEFAAGATVCAMSAAAIIPARRPSVPLLACIPGLLGALVLSLLVLALCQCAAFRAAYDTPAPLLLALTLLVLPLAIPLRWLLDARSRDPALHAARLPARAPARGALLWRLEGRPRFLAGFLLFCWAYFDFTASSILAPVGLTPVFVRLHNLAHYGQTAVLSAMLLAAFAAPVLAGLIAAAAVKFFAASHFTRRK